MRLDKYPDGTSYVTIPSSWENTHQEFDFKLNSYESVIHLAQVCDALIHNNVKATITITCLIDAQADRRFNEFQSSGLAVVARILEPYVDGHNISLKVYHPHNPEVVESLFTSVEIIDNSDFITNVLTYLAFFSHKEYGPDKKFIKDTILMSSDAGGFKPLMKLCDKLGWKGETDSAAKSRKWVDGESKLIQKIQREDFEGKDVLIVDDICIHGGTFKGLAKMLRERNVGKIHLAVSHMMLKRLSEDDPITDYFDFIFVTNSRHEEYRFAFEEDIPVNLEVVDIFNPVNNEW